MQKWIIKIKRFVGVPEKCKHEYRAKYYGQFEQCIDCGMKFELMGKFLQIKHQR